MAILSYQRCSASQFRNSRAVKIEIPRKVFSSKRWLSPLTMRLALPASAASRNFMKIVAAVGFDVGKQEEVKGNF
jgi:hypothetical protein